MSFKLNVNGRSTTVDVPADMPLLWVIRDVLNLRGTKFGCGAGLCGACTVHLNGRAVRSCQTPVSAAANAQITTLEGLSANGSHAVQLAWQEIDDSMNGNICRCGTYLRIRPAIHRAAVIAQNRLTLPTQSARNLAGKV
jgi:isoquinoline 1-oxidoreductase alpha subunit